MTCQKPALFISQSKKNLTWLKYAPQNRSSPRVVSNRNMAIEKLKINYLAQK